MLLFPGQGAQRQAMAAALAQHELAADLFQTANDAAGCDVKAL
jgi:malonyl CoA-acyl carrier protein transacylase